MMTVLEALQTAKLSVLKHYPYLSPIVHKLVLIKEPRCPTLAVDARLRVYYNPDFINKLAQGADLKTIIPVLSGVMLHETMHVLMRHIKRNKAINGQSPIDNIAMDMEINSVIRTDNIFKLPEQDGFKPIFPNSPPFNYPEGLTFEEYYTKLMQEIDKAMKQAAQGTGVASGNCGEGATGKKQGYEQEGDDGEGKGNSNGDDKGNGNGKDSSGISETDTGASEVEVDMAVNSAADLISKYAGSVHQTLKRHAGALLEKPKVRWQTVLRRIITANIERIRGFEDSGYHRLNNKSWGLWDKGHKVCLPSRFDTPVNIAVGIDTSGSMGTQQLRDAITEISGIVRAMNCPVRAYCIDTEVSGEIQEIEFGQIPELSGGGGTDMGQGIWFADTMKPRPNVVIILTDCYTPWPKDKPNGMRVVICAIGNNNPTDVPSWADLVIAEDR